MRSLNKTLDGNNPVMKEVNLLKINNSQQMDLTEDQKLETYGKHYFPCTLNTLLPYEYELTCVACGYNNIKRKKRT